MSESRVQLLRLRMQLEGERNLEQAARLVDDLRQEFNDLARAEQLNTRVADAMETATKQQNTAIRATADAYNDAAVAARKYGGAVDDASKKQIEQSRQVVGDYSTTFGAAASVFGGGGGGALSSIGDILGLVEYIPLAVQGLSSLNPVMIALAAAAGGVAIALGEYNRQLDVQKKALEGAFDAQDRYIEALRNFNSEQAQAALDTELENRRFLVIEANNTQAAIWEAWDQSVATFGEAGARALQALGQLPTNALQTRLDELNGQIAQSEGYLIRLRGGLEAGAFAANTAAEAEARLTAERAKLAQITTSAAVRADQLTAEQRAKRIDEINREIELLQIFGGASEETQAQIANLTAEADGLRMVFNSTADAAAELAAKTAAINQQTENYFDAVETTVRAEEALFKARQDAQAVYDKYTVDSRKISQDAEERYQEILAESGDKRADIIEKTEKQIQKIQRDSGRELFNAVAERDALAAYLAAQKADDQLQDAQDAQADQVKEFEKGQEKQLRALQSSVSKQVAALDASYRAQQQIAASAQSRAMIDLMNAKNAETQIALSGSNGVRTIMSQMWGQLTIEAVNGVSAILTQTRRLVSGMGGTNMYVNGVNANSPAAYDLVGVGTSTRTTTQQVFGAVDTRLNQYFNAARVITRD